MMENSTRRWKGCSSFFVVLICNLLASSVVHSQGAKETYNDFWKGLATTCVSTDSVNASISCHGVRIVRRIVQEFLERSASRPSIEIFNGMKLVEKNSALDRKARLLKGGSLLNFLENRQLQIRLINLLPDNIESVIAKSLPVEQGRKSGGGGGGGKGGEGYMLMAMMMGKMMGALGFGALGMVAMKALMVSTLALMLSLIIAAKKLSGGHDDGGGEHHVVYAQEVGHHHHRRRSAIDQEDFARTPYRGYAEIYSSLRAT